MVGEMVKYSCAPDMKLEDMEGFKENTENVDCFEKVKFDGAVVARKAAKRKPGRMAYKCDHCHGWHVGSRAVGKVKNNGRKRGQNHQIRTRKR